MKNGTLWKQAFVRTVPVLAGYVLIGFGFGMVLRDAGYGLWWALAMSVFIYAGCLQYVGVSLLAGPASVLVTVLTSLMINARYLFYSLSMVEPYRKTGKLKPYLLFAMSDETYALVSSRTLPEEVRQPKFYLLVSLFNQCYWVLGTALGSLAAAALSFDTDGVAFSMTALFVASYTEQLRNRETRGPAILGLLVTLAARLAFGRDIFLIPAMVVITAVLLVFRSKFRTEEEASHE